MDKIVMTDKIDRLQLPVVKPVAKKDKNTVRSDLPDETFKLLDKISRKTGLSKQYITGKLIATYFHTWRWLNNGSNCFDLR